MVYSQRALMRKLYAELEGNRESILAAYALADERGEVRRTRNGGNTSSREYAIRLWANGIHTGWLVADKSRAGASRRVTKTTIREEVLLFEEPLAQMGLKWREDPSRPRPSQDSLDHWSKLITDWCADATMPLLIRKGGHRALLGSLPSGRAFARCDNSPAHWAFMGCCAGERPSLPDVLAQLRVGELPLAMARARSEKALIDAGTHFACGGFINRSKYGQVNKFTDGKAYKLCHLKAVGLGSRGEVEDFDESSLREHMRLLLNPANMIVVPLRYAGVGECQAFLDAFLPEA